MNVIERVEIEGLMGRARPITIDFDENYNFIIGQNGTGKTTLINLIAAVLMCDVERLAKIQFDRILIRLKGESSSKGPVITVTSGVNAKSPYPKLAYSIKESSSQKAAVFNFDDYADVAYRNGVAMRHLRTRLFHEYSEVVRRKIENLLKVRWLSIHRTNDMIDGDSENRHQSPVDRKLSQLRKDISIYLGRLSKNYGDRILDFQQTSLLSMIRSESGFTLEKFSKEIDLDLEKGALESVFAALQVSKNKYQELLDKHAKAFKKAAEKFEQHKAIGIDELAIIYNGWKAHVLVQEYRELEKKKTDIFSPRDTFIKTVNDLIEPRKCLSISERNELVVKAAGSSDELEFDSLSSGEKQLLIILGEALLQESARVVYIADEPELSLHISWQEKLTGSIKSVNANAQIIFATHSPDIVNAHGDKVIDMEFI